MRLLTKPVLHGGDCGNCTQQALLVGLSYLELQSCLAGNEQKGKMLGKSLGTHPLSHALTAWEYIYLPGSDLIVGKCSLSRSWKLLWSYTRRTTSETVLTEAA